MIFFLFYCHVKMEKAREVRKDSDGRRNSTEQEHTERQKSKGNPGWQERVLRM